MPLTVRAGDRSLAGTTRDLSEGGLRCVVPRQHAPGHGDVVYLEFDLQDVGGIVARAKVVRVEQRDATEVGLGLAYVVRETEADGGCHRREWPRALRRVDVGASARATRADPRRRAGPGGHRSADRPEGDQPDRVPGGQPCRRWTDRPR